MKRFNIKQKLYLYLCWGGFIGTYLAARMFGYAVGEKMV